MKRILFSLAVSWCVVNAQAVSIDINQVQQRYPWNGIVDIDYTISLDDGEFLSLTNDTVSFEVTDASVSPAKVYRPATFLSLPHPLSAGRHRVAWNANADGFTNKSASVSVKAKVTNHAEQYMIIDVSDGSADYFPVTFMDGKPAGGFANPTDNTYRGDKIALRLIWPGGFIAGSPANEPKRTKTSEVQHVVSFTNAFYIGVFEITQKQWFNVMNSNPSKNVGDYRPVDYVSYLNVRGGYWPSSSDATVDTFVDVMRKKCRAQDESGQWTVEFPGLDIPTEFQWEYACRAGTTTPVYDGVPIPAEGWKTETTLQDSLQNIARHSYNTSDGKGDPSYITTTTVGLYQPNAWGLYDMLGNVQEWCRDWFAEGVDQLGQVVEPVGPAGGTDRRCLRGGSYLDWGTCRSAARMAKGNYALANDYGFRLSVDIR